MFGLEKALNVCDFTVKKWQVLMFSLLLFLMFIVIRNTWILLTITLIISIILLSILLYETFPDTMGFWLRLRFIPIAILLATVLSIWIVIDFAIYHLYDKKRLGERRCKLDG